MKAKHLKKVRVIRSAVCTLKKLRMTLGFFRCGEGMVVISRLRVSWTVDGGKVFELVRQ